MTNFIYTKNNALSGNVCLNLIKAFEESDLKQPGVLYGPEGISSDSDKKSTDITFDPSFMNKEPWSLLLEDVIVSVKTGVLDYLNRHSTAMSKMDPIDLYTYFNMQKYEPNEGFFGWHCERAGIKHSDRLLVWMVYLNTLTDRGETEFFYQQHFERPERGKLVIWPSDWSHLHRGVPSPTETKYILTGWFTHIKN
jgi:prolyl 4-hydroxylase